MHFWMNRLTAQERRTMFATGAGWALDALDVQVYSFVIPTLIVAWGITQADAGLLGTAALLSSAIGGWGVGVLCDRFGRVRMLQITIVWFAIFTFLSGFTQNFSQLFVCRALQGLGFGGEWAAGSVLMGEVIRSELRGRAVGTVQASWHIGWGVGAALFALMFSVLPTGFAWRSMFWIGILPALLTFYIRHGVAEPDTYIAARKIRARPGRASEIFSTKYAIRTVLCVLVAAGVQGGYYALATWLPTFLKVTRGLSIVNTGGYLLVIIVGSWMGCMVAAHLTDAIGKRKTFISFAVAACVVALAYTRIPISNHAMLILGFPLGFFCNGIFAPMGPFLTEMFPTHIRGAAQGFCFNAGRALGALFPTLVGLLSARMPLGEAIGLFAIAAYAILIGAAFLLPRSSTNLMEESQIREEISSEEIDHAPVVAK